MITITSFEASLILRSAMDAYASKVYEMYIIRRSGCMTCGDHSVLNELRLYIKVLSRWEQDKFNHEQSVNCLTSYQVQSIYSRIKEIQ